MSLLSNHSWIRTRVYVVVLLYRVNVRLSFKRSIDIGVITGKKRSVITVSLPLYYIKFTYRSCSFNHNIAQAID